MMGQVDPKWSQDVPKMAQDGPKMAPDSPKMASKIIKNPKENKHFCSWTAFWPQAGPRWLKLCPKMASRAEK